MPLPFVGGVPIERARSACERSVPGFLGRAKVGTKARSGRREEREEAEGTLFLLPLQLLHLIMEVRGSFPAPSSLFCPLAQFSRSREATERSDCTDNALPKRLLRMLPSLAI